MKNHVSAIIVAAGRATRFGSPKVLNLIGGVTALERVVSVFQSLDCIDRIVVVIDGSNRAQFEEALAGVASHPPVDIRNGGALRQDSVLVGVLAAGEAEIVVAHDAARPLVTAEMITAAITGIRQGADAAICAVPVVDTIKRVAGENIETLDRAGLWRAQTPQAFRRAFLLRELQLASQDGIEVTDEASLIERAGGRVVLVPGSDRNLKLTVPGDRDVLEALMSLPLSSPSSEPAYRTGIGYDVHRLVPGHRLVLGGVEIPTDAGLEGHSDADVIVHAICDALLGAAALGDIGQHFPPSDHEYRGISSLILLERVRQLLAGHGLAVVNIDATIVAEAPKIGPHALAMRQVIGDTLQLSPDRVGIKATTNEGMGFAGRREGIAAIAVATVWKVR